MGEGSQGGGAEGGRQGRVQGFWYCRGEVTQCCEEVCICLSEGSGGGAPHCCYAHACQHSVAAILNTITGVMFRDKFGPFTSSQANLRCLKPYRRNYMWVQPGVMLRQRLMSGAIQIVARN